mgnify:FL=1
MNEKEKEEEKLTSVVEIIKSQLITERADLKKLFNDWIGSRDELWRQADFKKLHISNLETSKDNPYFARIDFTIDGEDGKHVIYIGKHGVMMDSNIVVTDWRAPISSLYYNGDLGRASYEAPDGTINGDLSLKRQFEIEKGQLLDYYDVDLVSNDQLLQKYLNTNNDARLKTIVATIQQEQNDVIRKPLRKNLIIQGVAGSGKTTVALHRIAYLVYNYVKNIRQNQYMVIGPNPVFLKYIKNVLPDLDVSGVIQYTFEDFVQEYLDEDFIIKPSENKVNDSILGKKTNDIDKFKCSEKYEKMLNLFMNTYIELLTSNDLSIGDFVILPKEKMQYFFNGVLKNKQFSSLKNMVELTINRICNYIEMHHDSISSSFFDYRYNKFKSATTDKEKTDLTKEAEKIRSELNKNFKSTLRKYFNKATFSPIKIYKLFISMIEDYNIYNYKDIKELKKTTNKSFKENSFDFEDLSALLYIKNIIAPNKQYSNIRHVIVDEAQDLGEFNISMLKKSLPSATFSIFGDLAQSIYDYRGVDSWERLNSEVFDNDAEIVNFNKSYRTTAEIMNVADDVAESIGLNRSDLVVRHGNNVSFHQVDPQDNLNYIKNKIEEFKSKGHKRIAIISKTEEQSQELNNKLKSVNLNIPNISLADDLSFEEFDICTISNQLAKGLEFDAVIINNVDEYNYSSDSDLDMKLLYVAITRALHDLDIVYTDELTKPLNKTKAKQRTKIIN